MKELLVREPIKVMARLGDMETEVLQKARECLGYSPQKNPNALAQSHEAANDLFAQVGIEPFSPDSVGRYKARMLAKLNARPKVGRFFNKSWGGGFIIFAIVATLVLTVSSIVSWAEATASSHPFFYAHWQLWLVPAVLLGLVSIGLASMDDERYEWTKVPINEYSEEVPYFVLLRAVEIKTAYPEVKIYVDALQKNSQVLDPFLVVKIEGYLYYLDVWDEPAFEGRRVK